MSIDTAVGLQDDKQVEEMRAKYGQNALTPPERDPWWKEFLDKFNDLTIQILLIAAVVSLAMTAVDKYYIGNQEASFYDSFGIFFAVFLATTVGFLSERKSAKEFELLNEVKEDITVKVTRGGEFRTVGIKDLVVGDVINVDLGDKIPADGVIFDSQNLCIDEAMLTGESVPAEKHNFTGEDLAEAAEEARVSKGTMISDGHGRVIVTAVGDKTKMGGIADTMANSGTSEEETPLKQKLARLAKQISVVGIVSALFIFVVMCCEDLYHASNITAAMAQNGAGTVAMLVCIALVLGGLVSELLFKRFLASMDVELESIGSRLFAALPMVVGSFVFSSCVWGLLNELTRQPALELLQQMLTAFMVAVTIIVVAVPEGLPMMVTISLALNMMKMSKENCLVRRLIASETIGSATVICTDKTGTLTENKMTPVWFFCGMKTFDREHAKEIVSVPEWESMKLNMAVNTGAQLELKEGKLVGIGNPTDCALVQFLHGMEIDYKKLREDYPRRWQLDYNSQRKRSVSVVEVNGKETCFIKGAPERILEACSFVSVNGQLEPIEKHMEAINKAIFEASDQALRVIGFSEKLPSQCSKADGDECMKCGQRVFIGMVGIVDPLRKEVPAAVHQCSISGIDVKMITGDALPTAKAIARGAGILKKDGLFMTSKEFNEIPDDELPEKAKKLQVLARSTPMDKHRLVQALHKVGAVVAMTGDGTNDAPALKAADVGLSMGITGTEVAKEASDIVLVDDNFTSILTGVWWGRTLYQNIQRFLQFQLSVNVVALMAAFLGPLVGCDLPLTVVQLLWVNIIMDTFAALALSTDPPRKNTMNQKPVSRDANIITPAMAVNMGIVGLFQLGVLYWVLLSDQFVEGNLNGTPEESILKLTVFFTTFVMFQFWNIFNCRNLRHDEAPWSLMLENKYFMGIVAFIFVGQVLMVQTGGPVAKVFRTTPLDFVWWCKIMALTFSVVPVSYIARLLSHSLGYETKIVESEEETPAAE